ncbi:hypothetical protein BH10PSE19_BH10PSE19_09870 [soil metagenome]
MTVIFLSWKYEPNVLPTWYIGLSHAFGKFNHYYAFCLKTSKNLLEKNLVNDFVMQVTSNHIVYSCWQGKLFEEEIENSEEFEQTFKYYQANIDVSSPLSN